MFDPISTYRVQLHKGFAFSDLERILPYLHQLGVKTVYASPIFKAVPGSIHGYDITDPNTINPEIGSLEQLYRISETLKKLGMSWLQDIVPNHMALHTDNEWLMDVLKNGQASRYAFHFDIDWQHPLFRGKLVMPVLSTSLDVAIEQEKVQLAYINGIALRCNDIPLPLNDMSLLFLSQHGYAVPGNTTWLEATNKNKALLNELLQQQHYIPCCHSDTDKQLNYRRFFTINGLISLNMQRQEVFDDYHRLIKKLCADGVIQGLRVDHIDGLYDPEAYLCRLRKLTGKDTYISVEKILEPGEELPLSWPVAGTTGYDFLGMVNSLFTAPHAGKKLTRYYERIIGKTGNIMHLAQQKKLLILHQHTIGDLDNLCRLAEELLSAEGTKISALSLRAVIGMFLAKMHVYRYYGSLPLAPDEATAIAQLLQEVAEDGDQAEGVRALQQLLLEKPGEGNSIYNERATFFYRRCMQLAGPLMAKGVEDTLMYTYNCFIGHNEVGDSPGSWGCSIDDFHAFMQARRQKWPLAQNATATHDTKRGEDARARLNMITFVADEWNRQVTHWHEAFGQGNDAISPNDEYLIYQALMAVWPARLVELDDVKDRFKEYITKALREGKEHSNWQAPCEEYEQKVILFAEQLLNSGNFRNSMMNLLASINEGSIAISLCQLLLKITCPGIPDIYRGNELWDLNMVDPDNRRPVDYELRKNQLEDIPEQMSSDWWMQLWRDRNDGRIKMALTNVLLKERGRNHSVFSEGEYLPLTVKGKHKSQVLAFARRFGENIYAIIVPLNMSGVMGDLQNEITVTLPGDENGKWLNVLTHEITSLGKHTMLKQLIGPLPFAFLRKVQKNNERSSGVLMPVFSLPTPYGIGDLGNSAREFIDLLKRGHQKIWQLLPLDQTVAGEKHSPYSSISAAAMNTLFIAPDELAEDGLIHKDELKQWQLSVSGKIDYEQCRAMKEHMLKLAWERFSVGRLQKMQYEFEEFCTEHASWINDYALYVVIKREQAFEPWYSWPLEYRQKQKDVLDAFAAKHSRDLEEVKWQQYLTYSQWQKIRQYARIKGVSLFGDMPFYVSYDSVDVWVHPELFCIDRDGNMTGIAGVPPDLFSETGQLWNMPTYNWSMLKDTGYSWWINRLKRNLELFDLVRIDHFRAFETYWQVPPRKETAENGKWFKGPGLDFFDTAQQQLGALSIIAEDLGEEMEDVYKLRDDAGLPGMKVLQFAWGDNMPTSVDAPHNHTEKCIVYTGTHDNNTTRGWWMEEARKSDKKRMEEYTGQKINSGNVHHVLIRLAYSSIAQTAIIPIQDILGLGSVARINTPGTNEGNWTFRLQPGDITAKTEKMLRQLTRMYNRH